MSVEQINGQPAGEHDMEKFELRNIFSTTCLTLTLVINAACNQSSDKKDTTNNSNHTLVQPNGSYTQVPLEKDVITLKVIQSGVQSLSDFPTVQQGLQHNLDRMIALAKRACNEGKKPDILLYHEFPLTGYYPGTRTEKLKFTVTIPGPETQALGKIAKACDTYLVFGSYATDPDWPRHILSLNTVIGRDGTVVKKFWKSRNIKRLYKDKEITTTTIEAVRDKYRSMYGIDEEFPVLRTELGNIAVSTVQMDPFIFAAFAMKGTEIMLRTATLYSEPDVLAMARSNRFYSAMANITMPEDSRFSGGNSIIVSPEGKVIARDPRTSEDGIIAANIPIAEFRKNRKIPNYSLEMVKPILEQYQQEIPINHLNMPAHELPETGEEMKTLLDKVSRYLQ